MIRSLLIALVLLGSASAGTPLKTRVAEAIRAEALLPDDASVEIARMTPVRGAVETVSVTRFDRRTGRFSAEISHGSVTAGISGQARITVPVVVASSTLRRGHVIERGDVALRYVSMSQVPADAFLVTDEVVGSSARRSLAGGRPVTEGDVGRPIVLRKNASIEIVYATSGMQLSARGRALDEGAVGDSVRVVTDGQGNIVLGEVAGPSRVVVR